MNPMSVLTTAGRSIKTIVERGSTRSMLSELHA